MTREEMRDRVRRRLEATDPFSDHLTDAAVDAVWPEVERLRSWAGLMETLDEHYPADVFTGTSGDKGPRIIALTREVDRLLKKVAEWERVHAEMLRAIYEAVDPKAAPTGRDADEIRARVASVRGVIQSVTEEASPAEDAAHTLQRLIAEINGEHREVRS